MDPGLEVLPFTQESRPTVLAQKTVQNEDGRAIYVAQTEFTENEVEFS
jgi:hypothetical protein